MRTRLLSGSVCVTIVLGILLIMPGCTTPDRKTSSSDPDGSAGASYVGGASCKTCHEREYASWTGSDHDRAMEPATEETVLGDFNDAGLTWFGVTSRFMRDGERFVVHTEGPEGKMEWFTVAFTFGIDPLQQYLVAFPGGRYQVLPLCWDTRSREAGGQRWFHIYQDERIRHDDELYWTGRNQNWNYMCAECHSTNLRKNFDAATRTYATAWSEIDVSCEACHGPGSRHVAWAEARQKGVSGGEDPGMGLAVRLKDPDRGTWVFDRGATTARRSVPLRSTVQIEACARCHARRVQLSRDYVHGEALLQTHYPEMLEERLYFPDGQIRDEVYVYGSFRQSRMYQHGVVCSDCHDPHRADVYVGGDALCYRCHAAGSYGTRAHHFHNPDSTGARCTGCHAPERTYMVVDPRLDHSFRIPRPDLSVRLGTPNACTGCHSGKPSEWAADSVARWYGPDRVSDPHYAEALHAGREGFPGAGDSLARLVLDRTQAAIVRATAASMLATSPSRGAVSALETAAHDPDPITRIGAIRGVASLESAAKVALITHLLRDDVRVVRGEAARMLADVSPLSLARGDREALERATREYIEFQRFMADRPESFASLGNLYRDRGMTAEAESAYSAALDRAPEFTPASVNLADLYRAAGREQEGEEVLRRALARQPDAAAVHHALGLLLVRQQRHEDAMRHLERAFRLMPDDPTFGYVYGVGLHSRGRSGEALTVLDAVAEAHPYDREVLLALVTINRDEGNLDDARRHASRLVEAYPGTAEYRYLLEQLSQIP